MSEVETNISLKADIERIPKGRNVSGRSWKYTAQKRASSLITKTKQNGASKSWTKKMNERFAKQIVLEREKELKEERRQKVLEKKNRRLENEKRRMENEFKVASQSAKTLGKNASIKMKNMNKKQLRQIKKTRMNSKTGVVEYVGAYEK